MRKPSFKVSQDGKTVEVDEVVYNFTPCSGGFNRINGGPRLRRGTAFHELRNGNYGEGFKQGSLGDQSKLLFSAYLNHKESGANLILLDIEGLILIGNTTALYTPQLIIVQDNPSVEDGKVVMEEKGLVSKLSKYPKNGVRFSDDGSIRASTRTQIEYKHSSEQIKGSSFPILLTGDLDSPEKIAEILKMHKLNYATISIERKKNIISIPSLSTIDFGLDSMSDYHRRIGEIWLLGGRKFSPSEHSLPISCSDYPTQRDYICLSFGVHR